MRGAGPHCDGVERSCSTTGAPPDIWRLPAIFRNTRYTVHYCTLHQSPIRYPYVHPSFLSCWLPLICCEPRLPAQCQGPAPAGPASAKSLCHRQPRILHDRKVTAWSLLQIGHVAWCCGLPSISALLMSSSNLDPYSVSQPASLCPLVQTTSTIAAPASSCCCCHGPRSAMPSPAGLSRTSISTWVDTNPSGPPLSV